MAPVDCPTSLTVQREPASHVTVAAVSCWGAFGRDKLASQEDIRSWLAWWEDHWLGSPVEDAPGRLAYAATGAYGACEWTVTASIALRDDHRLESALAIDFRPWCGPLLAPGTERRVQLLARPFAAARRTGSDEPGAF